METRRPPSTSVCLDCPAVINNFMFLLGKEERGPDGKFHAISQVFRYDLRKPVAPDGRHACTMFRICSWCYWEVYAVAGRTRDIINDKWGIWDLIPLINMDMRGQCSITTCISPMGSPHCPLSNKCVFFAPIKKGT